MTLVITSPKKTINGLLTDVLAIESQALYPTQRKDFDGISGGTLGGFRVISVAGDQTALFINGAAFNFNSSGVDYWAVCTQDSIFGADTTIYSTLPITGTTVDGPIVLQRVGYSIKVTIRDLADTFTVGGRAFSFVPPQNGFINIDLHAIIRTYMASTIIIPFHTDSFSFQYVATFAEWWDNTEQNTQSSDTMQAVRAYKQIGLEGGALMHESLLRPTGVATDSTLGMILTVFKNPVMWRGWNRLISYVIDSDVASRVVTSTKVLQQEADVNKLIGSQVTATVEHIFSPPRIVVQPLTETTAYYNAVVITDQTGNVKITDGLYYEQRNECPNPIMLDWINSIGGIESHLFSINQVVEVDVNEGIVAESPVDGDFADVTRTKRRFRGPYIQRMTLYADDLTRDQLDALREIKQTESLRCYLSKDGTQFVDVVIVDNFTTTYETKDKRYSYSVTIEFPDDYDFYKAKQYDVEALAVFTL